MAYGEAGSPVLPTASLIAMADVLVSTDEIDAGRDGEGGGWCFGAELNTGVLFFRGTAGSRAVVQAWRKAMMNVKGVQFINDQNIFNNVIHAAGINRLGGSAARTAALHEHVCGVRRKCALPDRRPALFLVLRVPAFSGSPKTCPVWPLCDPALVRTQEV